MISSVVYDSFQRNMAGQTLRKFGDSAKNKTKNYNQHISKHNPKMIAASQNYPSMLREKQQDIFITLSGYIIIGDEQYDLAPKGQHNSSSQRGKGKKKVFPTR